MILENRTRYRTADLEAVILGALAEAGITSHGRDRVIVTYGEYSGHAFLGKIRHWNGRERMWLRIPDPSPAPIEPKPWVIRHAAGRCSECDEPSIQIGTSVDLFMTDRDDMTRAQLMNCPKCRGSWIRTRTTPPAPHVRPARTLDVAHFVWLVRHEVGHWRGLNHSQMATSLLYWKRLASSKRLGPVGSELPPPPWSVGLVVGLEDAPPDRRKPKPDPNVAREKKRDHAIAKLAEAERKAKIAATLVKRWRRRVASAERALIAASRKR